MLSIIMFVLINAETREWVANFTLKSKSGKQMKKRCNKSILSMSLSRTKNASFLLDYPPEATKTGT